MDEAEKATAIHEALTTLANGNTQVADYIVANKAGILEGFKAGIEKRPVNPNATAALAEYQARKRAEKEANAAGNATAGAPVEAAPVAEAEAVPA